MKTYLEYKDDKSHKFWEIEQTENSFTVRYGKINTNGQSKTKDFDTEEKAKLEAEKLIKQKKKKRYVNPKENEGDKTEKTPAYELQDRIRIYKGDTCISGDLILDYDEDEDEDEDEDKDKEDVTYFETIIVEGNLTIDGNIYNLEDDYGKSLEVRGNLKVKNLIVGGSHIEVEKKIEVEQFIIQTYNHGELEANEIKAQVIIATAECEPIAQNGVS